MKEEGGGRGRNGNERQTNAKQMLGAVLFPSQDACAAPGDTGSAGLDSWSPGGGHGAEQGATSPPAHPPSPGFTPVPRDGGAASAPSPR